MRTKDLSTCFFLRNSIYSPAQQTKIKGTGKRNTNIEILRILLMLMVCFLHLAVHGYGYFSHNTHPLNNVSDHSFLLSLLVSLTIPAVNTYVLISGYFGIKFKWNSVFAFAFQALFFSFITYFITSIYSDYFSHINIVRVIFPISTGRWWFLTTYFLLMLLAPFIEIALERASRKQLLYTLILYFCINTIGPYLRPANIGENLQNFIFIYLLGAYLRRIDKSKIKSKYILSVFIISTTLILVLMSFVIAIVNEKSISTALQLFLQYRNPLIYIQSVSLLLLFLNFHPFCNQSLNSLSKNVFSIYLLSEGLGYGIYTLWASIMEISIILGLSFIFLLSAIAIILDRIRGGIFSKIMFLSKNK